MTKRFVVWMALASCVPDVTGAPCHSNDECPTGQVCVGAKCEVGSAGGAGGSGGGGAVGGGAGGGGGASGETNCSDGQDNDGDSMIDCEDTDCNGGVCRPVGGICDAEERCAGGVCPADAVLGNNTVCRPDAGPCDVEERCSGSVDCPPDLFIGASANVLCRPASDAGCDVPEICNGMQAACPDDGFKPAGTSCRDSAGPCDLVELCDGGSAACPDDVFAGPTVVCRVDAGPCDIAERCTLGTAACPADQRQGPTVVCRASAGGCDMTELCPGDGGLACPADVNTCPANQYCGGTSCVMKRNLGDTCTDLAQCLSGNCVDGVCCDSACTGPCRACSAAGVCTMAMPNTDPQVECGLYQCDGDGGCFAGCDAGACTPSCKASGYCNAGGTCVADLVDGLACTSACQCGAGGCGTFFVDSDQDGFGNGSSTAKFCGAVAPTGFSTDAGDCCDTDVNAHPGQTSYYPGQRIGCGGWDYNCVNGDEPSPIATNACQIDCGNTATYCTNRTAGWRATTAPPCGGSGTYVRDCNALVNNVCGLGFIGGCASMFTNITSTQPCR